MGLPNLQLVASPPDQIEAEAVAAFFFSDDRPLAGVSGLLDWRLNGSLTRLIQAGAVTGAAGEQLWMQANGKLRAPWVLFVGGGQRESSLDLDFFHQRLSHLLMVAAQSGVQRLVVGLDPNRVLSSDVGPVWVRKAWEGLGNKKTQCLVTFDQSWVNS